jgi:hypothetical protein
MFPNGNYVFISATTPGSTDNTIVFMVLNPQNEIINSFNISIQIQDFSLIAQTSTGILLYGQNLQTQEQNILFFDNQGKQKWNIAVNEANSTFIPYQLKMTDSNFILLGTKASTIDHNDNSLYAYEKADLSWISIPLNGSTYTQKTISTQNPTVALGMHLRTDGNWDVISATKVFKSLNTYSVHKINPDGFIIY